MIKSIVRISILTLLAVSAFMLLLSEPADDFTPVSTIIRTKLLGLLAALLYWILLRHWDGIDRRISAWLRKTRKEIEQESSSL